MKSMNRKGFTLIELLIVVVIIGILAAIAIPRFGATRERAFISAMQSDLRNLQTIQEQYYADPTSNYSYGTLPQLDAAGLTFGTSQGVTVAVLTPGAQGWAAEATHAGISTPAGPHCGIGVGNVANPDNAGAVSGQVTCAAIFSN